MHYCQSCDQPTAMEPDGDRARCPACGWVDETARRAPVFVVTGASGAGKTALAGPLARALAGRCVTFDGDWLLDSAGALSAGREPSWPAFRDAWLAVAHGVAQSGLPTVLLAPFLPEQLEGLPARRWVGPVHYLLLDCPDDVLRRRIEARPTWRKGDLAGQLAFARWLRANLPDQVDTGRATPEEAAAEVADWITARLPVR